MLGCMSHDEEFDGDRGPFGGPDYEGLHATLVDAIRYVTAGQAVETAAHEGLLRLRQAGLPVPLPPPPPPYDSSRDAGPPFAPNLADAPPHPEEPR